MYGKKSTFYAKKCSFYRLFVVYLYFLGQASGKEWLVTKIVFVLQKMVFRGRLGVPRSLIAGGWPFTSVHCGVNPLEKANANEWCFHSQGVEHGICQSTQCVKLCKSFVGS